MTFRVQEQHSLGNAQSPFRVIDESAREVAWANRFLDQQRVRGVADTTLRSTPTIYSISSAGGRPSIRI